MAAAGERRKLLNGVAKAVNFSGGMEVDGFVNLPADSPTMGPFYA